MKGKEIKFIMDNKVYELLKGIYEKEKSYINDLDFNLFIGVIFIYGMLEYANILERDNLTKEKAIEKIENAIKNYPSLFIKAFK